MNVDWQYLKFELEEVLGRWPDVHVAVGLKPGGGLVIRSQDERVDVSNIGQVVVQATGPETGAWGYPYE